MSFTDFYCNASTGSNMNGGSDENASPSYTATNGGWDSGTGVFTPTSGDPSASGVSVGQFAHVFTDGSTTPTRVARVTAVDSTTITLSTTAGNGTAPGTAGSGISINVGGVWKGPNGSTAFPFGFITTAATNAAGDQVSINLKNNATYSITAAITHNSGTSVYGYQTTVRDGGKAIIDGGTSGASYILFSTTANLLLCDLVFQNNGATGSQVGVSVGTPGTLSMIGCVVNSVRGSGISVGTSCTFIGYECEVYTTNQSNTSGQHAIAATAGSIMSLTRCKVHYNTQSNSRGVNSIGAMVLIDHCIIAGNGLSGYATGGNSPHVIIKNSDFYANGGDGVTLGNGGSPIHLIENSNFIDNGGYGINGTGSGSRVGGVYNCGFGAGTAANTSGTTTGLKAMVESGSVTYDDDVTPWTDPANGDFRIALAAAKNAGRGTFTELMSGQSGTVAYPDIGAAQPQGGGVIVVEDD